jgi:hypothetical protein
VRNEVLCALDDPGEIANAELPAVSKCERNRQPGGGPTPLAALVIAAVAAYEGVESWRGESCDCC